MIVNNSAQHDAYRMALGVAYEGTSFWGWQRQKGLPTVQQSLEEALSRVADHPVEVVCAGRTDRFVHASGQVIHCNSTAQRRPIDWVRGSNHYLPKSIAVKWVQRVDTNFHARYKAYARHYVYRINNSPIRPALMHDFYTWHPYPLCVEAMQEAANFCIGTHDFSALRGSGCQARHAIRQILHIKLFRRGCWIVVDVKANAFVLHMVRNLVGVLVMVGCGKKPIHWVQDVLTSRDRRQAGVTMPASGLCLVQVDYPDHYAFPQDGSDEIMGINMLK